MDLISLVRSFEQAAEPRVIFGISLAMRKYPQDCANTGVCLIIGDHWEE